jgi:hypothetical protein
MNNETLYVVTPYFNSWRYKSRKNLYENFAEYVRNTPNTELVTVEVAFGDRPFETDDDEKIQLRTNTELWHKERSINLAINRLPSDWKYVAWIDGDLQFARPDWALETIQLLQHYKVIQMFSESINLSPKFELIGNKRPSFLYSYCNGLPTKGDYGKLSHPGFAWAATRQAINDLGGLFDVAILGSGDLHMARCLTSELEDAIYSKLSPDYQQALHIWKDRCDKFIKRNVGYMPGLVLHGYHGAKINRAYQSRWKILTDANYSPITDIKCDSQGLYQFSGNKPEMEYAIRRYFMDRKEDDLVL